jgi:hypothetical protein
LLKGAGTCHGPFVRSPRSNIRKAQFCLLIRRADGGRHVFSVWAEKGKRKRTIARVLELAKFTPSLTAVV